MSSTKKIIAGLDFTNTDEIVLRYLKNVNTYLRPTSITFVNIHKGIDVPSEIVSQFPDLKSNINDKFIKEMVEETCRFDIVGVDQHYLALEGNPLTEIMNAAKNKDADLIVVGKKNTKEVGVSHSKLVRSSYCDVMIVPENGPSKISNILIASDFSEYSKLALNKAIELAEQANAKVTCLHIYNVPTGYSKTGKSFEEFGAIMLGHAKKDYDKFISSIDSKGLTIEPLFVLDTNDELQDDISNSAKNIGADMIVIGAKGRTNLAALFVGSVAEKVIRSGVQIPIYISKVKGSEYGMLDAIL